MTSAARVPTMTFGPATIDEDPEADGSMDDWFIKGGIESVHVERMDKGVWWAAIYLTNGERVVLHWWSKSRIKARWATNE